jgi:hypothetical protein
MTRKSLRTIRAERLEHQLATLVDDYGTEAVLVELAQLCERQGYRAHNLTPDCDVSKRWAELLTFIKFAAIRAAKL